MDDERPDEDEIMDEKKKSHVGGEVVVGGAEGEGGEEPQALFEGQKQQIPS